MHPDLPKLLDLQAKDSAIADIDAKLAVVNAEVSVLDQSRQRVADTLATARRAAADGVRRREELETKLESYRTLQERRKQRLEAVRSPKETAALMAEMDLARSVLAKEESEWIRSADQVTALETKAAEEERQLAQTEAAQTLGRAALAERRGVLESERVQLVRNREAAAARLEKTLRVRYDRLRRARAAVAVVVPLSGDTCGACYTAVPRNRRSQIRAGAILEACEACGVILYADGA
jgi:predicted  nucleic acid-binding Zn-ribbon protein